MANEEHFAKRATFYLATLHAQQLLSGEEYGLLAPTVAICILDHVRFRQRARLHSAYLLREREDGDVLTEDVQIHFIELPKFVKRDPDELVTPAEKWLHMLRFAQNYTRGGGALPEKLSSEEGVAMVFDKMQRAQSDEEVRAWALSRKMGEHDQATRERVARDEGLQQGLQLGRQEGRQEGRVEGRQEGHVEGRHEVARDMLDEGYDVSVVARLTRLSEAEVLAMRIDSNEGKRTPEA